MRTLALLSLLAFSPAAFADVIDDSSGSDDSPADTNDDNDDKGCATAPVLPGVLALGLALATLRRR